MDSVPPEPPEGRLTRCSACTTTKWRGHQALKWHRPSECKSLILLLIKYWRTSSCLEASCILYHNQNTDMGGVSYV